MNETGGTMARRLDSTPEEDDTKDTPHATEEDIPDAQHGQQEEDPSPRQEGTAKPAILAVSASEENLAEIHHAKHNDEYLHRTLRTMDVDTICSR